MSWWTTNRDKTEAAATKAAQESLDTVGGMDSEEKGAMWSFIAVAVVLTTITVVLIAWLI